MKSHPVAAHVACGCVKCIVVELEGLLDVLARLVQAVGLDAIQPRPVRLQDEGAVGPVLLQGRGHIHRLQPHAFLFCRRPLPLLRRLSSASIFRRAALFAFSFLAMKSTASSLARFMS